MGDLAKDINSKFENNKIKAMLNIIYTANWISSCKNEFFKPFGISPQQYNILRILRGANEPLRVQTIKARMLERSPNATRLMDKLCAKNYIERLPSEHDRRVVKIVITKDGISLLEEIAKTKKQNLLNNLTEDEALQLSNLLDKIR
ncbi:MAG: MarR family transcriptional regulator [Winogradskyella sp.]|uniref:MarR family winged helix-turn-helix transcriptional regulator n=1 Tax=Winogradskyella sp. TaxID=1883156 RepID=UPI00183ED338|nr:MarR family transcriptional regulator [Winogradskyella sp.]MBT8245187.1 MarR family transcriptional regulator [Winogradskyella sp.]NNK22636.1 MarR family transcriptional regulator [Winogradskyella sp.]